MSRPAPASAASAIRRAARRTIRPRHRDCEFRGADQHRQRVIGNEVAEHHDLRIEAHHGEREQLSHGRPGQQRMIDQPADQQQVADRNDKRSKMHRCRRRPPGKQWRHQQVVKRRMIRLRELITDWQRVLVGDVCDHAKMIIRVDSGLGHQHRRAKQDGAQQQRIQGSCAQAMVIHGDVFRGLQGCILSAR